LPEVDPIVLDIFLDRMMLLKAHFGVSRSGLKGVEVSIDHRVQDHCFESTWGNESGWVDFHSL
jgi:hypothetical protein